MNAQARIVETYFRLVRKCFTISDIKVSMGNNRQFDILAYQPDGNKYYHIEVGVTHRENWCPNLNKLKEMFKQKFFGMPQNKRPDNKNTDFAKGKGYLDPIKKAYSKYGIDYNKVIRVWCYWIYNGNNEDIKKLKNELAKEFKLNSKYFETLSFRDEVLRELERVIETSNYDDEIIRTLSLLKEYKEQTNRKQAEQGNAELSDKPKREKDKIKYSFDGKEYEHSKKGRGKNRLVLAVIRKYINDNHDTSYKQLLEIFPDKLQGSIGVLKKIEEIKDQIRYFMKPEELLKTGDGVEIAVCSQWGNKGKSSPDNIDKFVKYATKELQYKIEAL